MSNDKIEATKRADDITTTLTPADYPAEIYEQFFSCDKCRYENILSDFKSKNGEISPEEPLERVKKLAQALRDTRQMMRRQLASMIGSFDESTFEESDDED